MNWAGPSYDDVGMELAGELWEAGIPTDLIPTSEIENQSLKVDEEGWVRYGAQRYSAVILYHPEFEKSPTAAFFNKAAKGKTLLFRMGDWTKDFEANDFDGNSALPGMIVPSGNSQVISEVKIRLKKQGILLQTPATESNEVMFGHPYVTPPTSGFCRLIDGTVIRIAGTNNAAGDPILFREKIQGHPVSFDAIGVSAVRLCKNGQVEAIAAGGLKSFRSGNFKIELDERVDLALWKNEKGEWEGVIQGGEKEIPPQLLDITKNWSLLGMPVPLP